MSLPSSRGIVRSAVGVFFEYDTPKIVHIRSKKVGVINRLIQFAILAYVIGYAIVYKKGYQEFDDVQGAVTSKVKGVVYTNFTHVPGLDGRIWDVADYVIPPQENGAFFVLTNVLITPVQMQGQCAEQKVKVLYTKFTEQNKSDWTKPGVFCDEKTACLRGEAVVGGNGVKTGTCVKSPVNTSAYVCEVYAWCPVEWDDSTTRRNIIGFADDSQLSQCRYNPNDTKNKFCPIFVLSKMVELAGVNVSDDKSISDLQLWGGVIQITITWNCNLDHDEESCLPEYSFRRLDRGDFKISRGFNFRYADHYKSSNHTNVRTLYKAYGIHFVVSIQGRAGQFRIVPLLLNIGSGLALLSIATILCDIIVLYILKSRNFYRENKYQDVKGKDAYESLLDQ